MPWNFDSLPRKIYWTATVFNFVMSTRGWWLIHIQYLNEPLFRIRMQQLYILRSFRRTHSILELCRQDISYKVLYLTMNSQFDNIWLRSNNCRAGFNQNDPKRMQKSHMWIYSSTIRTKRKSFKYYLSITKIVEEKAVRELNTRFNVISILVQFKKPAL